MSDEAMKLAVEFLDCYDNDTDDSKFQALAQKYSIKDGCVLAGLFRYYAAHHA